MELRLKASLKDHMQGWLDDYVDELGSCEGIWQDNTLGGRNAELMASACELVIDSMRLQNDLEQELNE